MRDQVQAGVPVATRRRLLKCMLLGAAGGVVWTVSGGVPRALQLGGDARAAMPSPGDFTFVQISDTHIGFHGAANPDPDGTLRLALARVAQSPARPAMMVHTGDVSQLSKPAEFDAAQQLLKTAGLDTHFIPGEHDTIGDDGKGFVERFGRTERRTGGWYSFDQGGVHFVALVNVLNLKPGGLGYLGPEQLAWLQDDLKARSASTPIIVLAHMPLWSVAPEWGWGTDDAAEAISYLKPFGSVTVLNGHIHQVIQKVEGAVTFRTAMSTALPQAAPGTPGASPGPLKVPENRLKSLLGIRRIDFVEEKAAPSISDASLA